MSLFDDLKDQYEGKNCLACNEGILNVSEEVVQITHLEVYQLSVITYFPKCNTCGASILTRSSRDFYKEGRKKAIEKLFYN